jgi:RNA polymerase sigma-70 factor, ECF subfamily
LHEATSELPLIHGEARVEIASGDFDRIVRENQQRICRVLTLLLRNPDDADCLTQECFLRAFSSRSKFRGDSSVGTWLVRIAINLANDHARNRRLAFWKRLQRGTETAEVGDPGPTPEQLFLARERARIVREAANRLAPQQRTAFLLRFGEEMSLEEVAAAMDLEVGTVKAHLFHATRAVRRDVARLYPR